MRLGVVLWMVVALGRPVMAADGLAEARALAIVAEGRLGEGRAAEAAGLFERAGQVGLEAGWWIAAGDAWIAAMEPGKAIVAFRRAAVSAGEARRVMIAERIAMAERCEREVVGARAATLEGKLVAAAQGWSRAFERTGARRYGVEAARAFDEAGRYQEAARRYRELALRSDLTLDERAEIETSLAEVRMRLGADGEVAGDWRVGVRGAGIDDERGDGAALGLVVGGAILTVFGAAALAVSEDARVELRHAEAGVVDGRIEEITRADALALSRTAKTWNVVGWVAGGVGLGAVIGGGVWMAVEPGASATTVSVGGRF